MQTPGGRTKRDVPANARGPRNVARDRARRAQGLPGKPREANALLGLAPPSQADLVLDALRGARSPDELERALEQHADDRLTDEV